MVLLIPLRYLSLIMIRLRSSGIMSMLHILMKMTNALLKFMIKI